MPSKAARARAIKAANSNYRAAPERERVYIAWLQAERGYDLQTVIVYAQKGQAGIDAMQAAQRPRTRQEIAGAVEADKPEQVRRWARIDRNCPFRGCLYPVNHSGPHRVVADLSGADPIAELDKRAGRVKLAMCRQPGGLCRGAEFNHDCRLGDDCLIGDGEDGCPNDVK